MHVRRDKTWRNGGCGRVCLVSMLAAVGVARAAPLRYAIEPGNQLVYERRVRVESSADGRVLERYSEQLRLWALDRQENKLLLIAESLRAVGDRAGPARGVVFHMDYRGRLDMAGEVLPVAWRVRPVFDLLPVLPPAFDAGRRWESPPDVFGHRWRFRRQGADAAHGGAERVDFEVVDTTGVWAVAGISERGALWFDTNTGRVVRLESRRLDTRRHRRTHAVVRLFEEQQMSPAWCRRRAAEAEKYLYTLRLEHRLRDRVGQEPDRIGALLRGLDRIWTERLREMPPASGSPLRKWARDQRRRLRDQADVLRARARIAQRWLTTPVRPPAATRPAASGGKQGPRVVLMAYCHAASVESLRALHTLCEVRQVLPAEDFRVVCRPVGGESALSEIATLCGRVPVLPAAPGETIPPEVLPAFRVLTPNGRTLRVYFGSQPGLARKLRPLVP